MGFGSYEEDGGNEQNVNEDEEDGEAVTKVGESEDGEDSIEDESVTDMLEHL